jgi:tetratricopeptide (TPR) repeat protein
MNRMLRAIIWLPLTLPMLAASSTGLSPEEAVRRGNAAFNDGRPQPALDLYEKGEDRAADPGLIAFNEGVALYRQERYSEAEDRFRRTLSDATGVRQARAQYNLAACLLQTAGERDVARLEEAVKLLGRCLRHEDADQGLLVDAAHNRALAKTLWVQAKARAAKQRPSEDNKNDDGSTKPTRPEEQQSVGAGDTNSGMADKSGTKVSVTPQPGDQGTTADGNPQAGKGNLDTIPDRAELTPMSREEAEEHLKSALERVLQERRTHTQRSTRPSPANVRDW